MPALTASVCFRCAEFLSDFAWAARPNLHGDGSLTQTTLDAFYTLCAGCKSASCSVTDEDIAAHGAGRLIGGVRPLSCIDKKVILLCSAKIRPTKLEPRTRLEPPSRV